MRLLSAIAVPFLLHAQNSDFRVPVLGWVVESQSSSLRAISGMPGAALLGDAYPLPFPVERFLSLQGKRQGLAISGGAAFVLDLETGEKRDLGIARVRKAALSPSGQSAILLCEESRAAILRNLSGGPELAADFTVDADPIAAAVSDDGALSIVLYAAESKIYKDGQFLRAVPEAASSAAFAPAAARLALSFKESNRVALMPDAASSDAGAVITGESAGFRDPSALRFLTGAQLAVAAPGAVSFIDTGTGESKQLPCACAPDSLEALESAGVYRLTSDEAGPLWLLAPLEWRIVFVPRTAPEGSL